MAAQTLPQSLFEATSRGDVEGLQSLLSEHRGAISQDQTHACLVLACHAPTPPSAAMLRCLLDAGAARPVNSNSRATTLSTLRRFAGTQESQERELLRCSPVVVAACRLHADAVQLLLQAGAGLPATVTQSKCTLPELAYYAAWLPAVDPPSALPMLRLLLSAGADPLASGSAPPYLSHAPRGRAGDTASFLLSCRSSPLLGAAVHHVLDQCQAGMRVLAPTELVVVLLAARLAGPGLEEEAEQLLAQAVHLGDCFPDAKFPAAAAAAAAAADASAAASGSASGSGTQRLDRQDCRASLGAADAARQPLGGGLRARRSAQLTRMFDSDGLLSEDKDGGGDGDQPGPSGLPPLGLSPGHHLRQALLVEHAYRHRLVEQCHRRQQAALGAAAGAGPACTEPPPADPAADPQAAPQAQLRAQLVGDAAMHGLTDVLALLLTQGASPTQQVSWVYPREDLPPQGYPDAPMSLPARTGLRSPLALAAAGGHRDAVAQLLRFGASVDLAAICHAVWSLNAAGVEALLTLCSDPLPTAAPCSYAECALNCPILLLLRRHLEAASVAAAHAAAAVLPADQPPAVLQRVVGLMAARDQSRGMLRAWGGWGPLFTRDRSEQGRREEAWAAEACRRAEAQLGGLKAAAVRIMDLLYAAGARINVYRDMCGRGTDGVWRMARFEGLRPEELEKFKVGGRNRLVWEAYTRPQWSRESHPTFHPGLKAASRALLLVARFGEEKLRCQEEPQANLQAQVGSKEAPLVKRKASSNGDVDDACSGSSNSWRNHPTAVAAAALGQLPEELLHKIVSAAAYPLSSWVR